MAGKLSFDAIPKLPDNWWDGTDAQTVWTVWDKDTFYLWGANSGNQFVPRGQPLNGGGMASTDKGPTRGMGHPHYVGIDTMALSKTANDGVFATLKSELENGKNIVVPVYLKHGDHNNGCYGLGTGYGLDVTDHIQIHAYVWEKLLDLASVADDTSIPALMWTPDVILYKPPPAQTPRVPLPDMAAVKAWAAKLAAAG